MGLTNPVMPDGVTRTEFGHGGFWAGYSFMAKKAFHPVVSSQMGWGSITQPDEHVDQDNIFVVNPAIYSL